MQSPRRPVVLIARAEPALHPTRPKLWLNLLIGAGIGVVAGGGLALLTGFVLSRRRQ